MKKNEPFFINRIRSIKYAYRGALSLIRNEASIKVQVGVAIIMTIIGLMYDISTTEWLFQTLAMGLILTTEAINSAIEEIADFIHPDHHLKIGLIKDISAGAVFIMAITAIIIGLLIYFPKIF